MLICRQLFRKNNNTINYDDNDEEIETEDEPVYCPDRNELLRIAETIQKFSLFSKGCAIVQSYANHVAGIFDQDVVEKSRQTASGD